MSDKQKLATEISIAAKEAEAKIDAGIKEAFDTGDWPDGFDIAAIVQEAINNSVFREPSE